MDDEREREYRRRERARRHDVPPRRSNSNAPRQRDASQPPQQRDAAPRRNNPPPSWEQGQRVRRRSQPPAQRYAAYENADEYDDEYAYDEQPGRQRHHRHSFLAAFFIGCVTCIICIALVAAAIVFVSLHNSQGAGLPGVPNLGGNRTYTQPESQTINLSTIQKLQVCDKIGNISITVDPQATQASVSAKKIVQASSQQAAQQLFQHMSVEMQPPGTINNALTCGHASQTTSSSANAGTNNSLTVNVTIPDGSGLMPNTNNSVDINVVLPPGILPHTPDMQVGIESSVGNIDVQGVSGLLKIKGNTGNITIKQSNIALGSTIDTGQGNITFAGNLLAPGAANAQRQQASSPSSFNFSVEKGNISMSLPQNTNVTLDTNTNSGSIQSNFAFPIQKSGDMASYNGPLTPGNANAQATLVVDVSLGNITYQKQNM